MSIQPISDLERNFVISCRYKLTVPVMSSRSIRVRPLHFGAIKGSHT